MIRWRSYHDIIKNAELQKEKRNHARSNGRISECGWSEPISPSASSLVCFPEGRLIVDRPLQCRVGGPRRNSSRPSGTLDRLRRGLERGRFSLSKSETECARALCVSCIVLIRRCARSNCSTSPSQANPTLAVAQGTISPSLISRPWSLQDQNIEVRTL
jgi:hypothetical protein